MVRRAYGRRIMAVSWSLLLLLILCLGTVLAVLLYRRAELVRMGRALDGRNLARAMGSHEARLERPEIDLMRCLGCGACVAACPEEEVLGLLHGQAVVLHGARCVGHAHCAEACPVGAIAVHLADLEKRSDIPAVDEDLSVPGRPGLFLAGEVNGRALIRNAIEQGRTVASGVALPRGAGSQDGVLDLLVVGAGPAGLACALEARSRGLEVQVIDQEPLGGTIAKFPRAKLVLTRPVELPGYGWLRERSYGKEDLLAIWQEAVAASGLTVREGVRFVGAQPSSSGAGPWRVETSEGTSIAHNVCLALGRRGSPRKLQVPGESLQKVAYSLIDARAYQDQDVLVVGGGDSAAEAALALAMQPSTRVILSYRQDHFFRLHARNAQAIEQATRDGRLRVVFQSVVHSIEPDFVVLHRLTGDEPAPERLPNDNVFAFLGGDPPVPLLESLGVSFDPRRNALHIPLAKNSSLMRSMGVSLLVAVAFLSWALWNREYYGLSMQERPLSPAHGLLRSSSVVGLTLGFTSAGLVITNLLYLLRRAAPRFFSFGSLRGWMGVHVATGICALLVALLHSGMRVGDTTGGHACLALVVLVATGSIGRYLYSFLPRAANGRELELEEVRGRLIALSGELQAKGGAFTERVTQEVETLVANHHWSGSLPKRIWALLRSRSQLDNCLKTLEADARAQGLSQDQITELVWLVRRAHRTNLAAAHFEDLRVFLASWRHIHRWIALLLVLLLSAHILDALRFGRLFE